MTKTALLAEDMDAILDDALDALDDSDDDDDGEADNIVREKKRTDLGSAHSGVGTSKPATPGESKDKRSIPFGPPRPPLVTPKAPNSTKSTKQSNETYEKEDTKDMEESLRQMFRDLAVEPPSDTANDRKPTKKEKPASPSPKTEKSTVSDEEKMLQNLFQGLMAAGGDGSADGIPDMDEIPDLDKMFAGMGAADGPMGGGAGLDTDHFMEGMMEQLLSKELMYEPMKQVTQKFPEWLASKKDELSPEEWKQRNRQYDCFTRLVQEYESEEEGKQTAKLLEIMQEVQEYGQPPPEIINEIAPGLELDEEGLPKMNAGMFPPFMGGNTGPEDCRIM